FRSGPDIIPGQALPAGFDAVLSGHIHRRQVLTHDLSRRVIAAPVVYPGSIERTSFAERDEEKGYTIVTIQPPGSDAPLQVVFEPLPVRPMVSLVLEPAAADRGAVVNLLVSHLRALDPDAVVRVQFRGPNADASVNTLSAACLRRLAPPTMNVDLARPVFNRPRQSRAFRV
ncbi:MAG: exonuclease SbcCD subunit D, partial [Anaerolineae bacterium]